MREELKRAIGRWGQGDAGVEVKGLLEQANESGGDGKKYLWEEAEEELSAAVREGRVPEFEAFTWIPEGVKLRGSLTGDDMQWA